MATQKTQLRRRGAGWVQIGYGVQVPAGLTGREALLAELAAWLPHLPSSAVFTGLTAACVHGLWLPPATEDLPVFVAMSPAQGEVTPVRRGLIVSRHAGAPESVSVDGLPVAPPAQALLATARHLSALDLAVLVDSALHLGACGVDDLASAAAPRRKGAPALRAAIARADGRSESPWETILRLLHEVLGVPVTPQAELYDEQGRFIARADLLVAGTRSVHEYDGAHHREAAQQRADLVRRRNLANAGYHLRGYTSDVLLTKAATVQRDCEAALGHVLPDGGLLTWHRLVRASLHTPAGRRRLAERLGRAR